jgi:hypothetical protein
MGFNRAKLFGMSFEGECRQTPQTIKYQRLHKDQGVADFKSTNSQFVTSYESK